jgi:RNA polymerase sigma-70 factor (ECF subfamily)
LDVRLPDPIVSPVDHTDPEQEAMMADSLGLALLVVLETRNPAERLAFVLHDMFGMPFEEIAPIVGRTPAASRKLASRARRRVRGTAPTPDADLARQRQVVDAFLAAARGADFEALLAVLDPDVVLHAETGALEAAGLVSVRGAESVAGNALTFQRFSTDFTVHPALVNGAAGLVRVEDGEVKGVVAFTIVGGRIAEIDILSDPDRVRALDLTFDE